ncbi:MAG: hypothetical protein ACRD3N_16490 [Terracidiphilus sp.]
MAVTAVERVKTEREGNKTNEKGRFPRSEAKSKRARGTGRLRAAGGERAAETEQEAAQEAASNGTSDAVSGLVVERIEDGAALLRGLLTEKLRTKLGEELADSWIERAIAGDVDARWSLQKALDAPKESPKEKQQGRSLAEIWSAEPEWKEASEETAEVGEGGLEPEN